MININYNFIFNDTERTSYRVELDKTSMQFVHACAEPKPDWAKLEFNQCNHCPLDSRKERFCPVAKNLVPLIKLCSNMSSYEQLSVEVETSERTYLIKNTTTQRAFSSLMGFVIATSACPHTAFFKPMARHHLPLANDDETLYRAVSSYLLLQYFNKKSGKDTDYDLQGLDTIYKNIQIINTAMATRLREASNNDAAVNAIVLLDMFAKGIPYSIDDALDELHYLYNDMMEQ